MKKYLNLFRLLVFVSATLLLFMNNSAFAQKSKQKQPDAKVTLNAYSFNDLLMAKKRKDKQLARDKVYNRFKIIKTAFDAAFIIQ